MKSYVYIALVVFLGAVAVQGYGPIIHRKKHGLPHKSSPWSHERPSHGPPHGSHHWPHHNGFGPPKQHGDWDSSGSDDYSSERDSSDRSGPSYEDSGYHSHHHSKHPCKPPHKIPPTTTAKPVLTTPKPITTTPKPITTTLRIPFTPSLPPHPAHTPFSPNPGGTTAAWITNPTTPKPNTPPTRTVGPIPRPPITTTSTPIWHPSTSIEHTTHWMTTTNSIPVITTSNPGVETTTAEEEEIPTLSPEMEQCIDSCHSTPEYNPVCGSNGETYNNEGKLFCAGSCGVNVTLVRRSVCPPPPPLDYDDDGETTTAPPATTTPPFQGRTPLPDFQRCMKLCRISGFFAPVCGSDLVTYMNMDRLKCAQSCGEVVQVLCEKPCAACGIYPVTPKTTTLRPPTTPQIGRSTQEPNVPECINACPVTSEYNPVCGSNRVSYGNPSKLLCAQLCGVDVAVVRYGPCGPASTSSTTTVAPPPSTLSPDVLNCIRRCRATSEYDPVCGTDDLTYNNLGNLQCSKSCGVEVNLKHKSRCVDEFDLGPDGSQTTQDINGNKDYVTTSLFTSPTTKSTPTTKPTTTPTTTTSTTTTPTTTTPTTTTPTTTTPTTTTRAGPILSSTLGFTIPKDILNDIFGSTTTQAPTSLTKNPDEDEDLDLDARYNNDSDTDKGRGRDHYSKIIFPD